MVERVWSIYIVKCKSDGLYVGLSQNVTERVKEHNSGQGCEYTRLRRPVELIYEEKCTSYQDACRRERQIKKFSRKKKLDLLSKGPLTLFEVSS